MLIITGDDLINVAATLMVRSLNSEVRIVLRMFNQNLIGRLGQTVRNVHALSTSLLTAPILAMAALTGQGWDGSAWKILFGTVRGRGNAGTSPS